MALSEMEIKHENLDERLLEKLNAATSEQIDRIPRALFARLWKRKQWVIPDGLGVNEYSALLNALNTTVFIVFEDDENGLDVEGFILAKKALKDKKTVGDVATYLRTNEAFVMGNKDVVNGMSMFRTASASKVWKMVRGLGKNPLGQRNAKYNQWQQAMRYFINALISYEANKKKVFAKHQLTHSDWYLLLYFYYKEGSPSEYSSGVFAGAFFNSSMNLMTSFSNMYKRGLVTRRGSKRSYKYSITPAGQEIVDRVLSEYMLSGM